MDRKLLVIDVAAMGYDLLRNNGRLGLSGLAIQSTQSIFPAVTCAVQASFRTASPPGDHGMVSNGLYFKPLSRVMFWEQSSKLVQGRRIWDTFAERGGTVGMMFWQQSLGENADLVLSPAPIHKHHGGMIQDCHAKPGDLYQKMCKRVGSKFQLRHYWGPMASVKSGDWIAKTACEVLKDSELAPELLLMYLPTLDYDLQRFGPDHPKASKAVAALMSQLDMLITAARARGYEIVIFGDYAIAPTQGLAVFPNQALAEAGLFATRRIGRMLYPNFHQCPAMAVVDHEIAHVYLGNLADVEKIYRVMSELPGVASVKWGEEIEKAGLNNPNCGELILTAAPGRWFAYPWWHDAKEAPDYAGHIDIHNKPGFDPCELFFGWPPMRISSNTSRIRGSHGRIGPGREVAWASTLPEISEPENLIDLASQVGRWLDVSK